jgi:hypothetical protein
LDTLFAFVQIALLSQKFAVSSPVKALRGMRLRRQKGTAPGIAAFLSPVTFRNVALCRVVDLPHLAT